VSNLYDDPAVATIELMIDGWLLSFAAGNPLVEAIDRGEASTGDEPRWYVRLRGDEKEHITLWMTLGQRTLRYECYVMPAPIDNVAAVYELVLRRNERLVGAHFAIGIEDAIFLHGELPLAALDEDELDRVIGTLYATVEATFPALIRLGYASKFAADVAVVTPAVTGDR
jgi:hypothetical protein